MSELQSTIEFSVELYKFFNVDLFQRGMYQVRCSLRTSSKYNAEIEVTTPEVSACLGSALVLGNYGACRPFQILYKNEEVLLKDVVLFRCHMLVDAHNIKESLDKAEFSLIVELWFSDTSPVSMVMVSSRNLQLNFSPIEGLHYNLPVIFDYFHLSAISMTIHGVLTALHQPSMKRGILRYVQSCAPKSSKSWSKIRSTHCSSLTDPVLPVNSNKIYSRISEFPQVHLEANDVILAASNNLKRTIEDFKQLLLEREEIVTEFCYDTLILKTSSYYDRWSSNKDQYSSTSIPSLAELCADNIRLWNYFLLNFSCKLAIQQHLSKKHHHLRVTRFAELFFMIENPRRAALGCYDNAYQHYLCIADLARRSKYLQNLPQLPVHCPALDGDSTTMPIIFEDQYQDPLERRKIQVFSPLLFGLKNSSKKGRSTLNHSKTDDDSPNCSCKNNDIWEKRKCSHKAIVDADSVNINFTLPTRHSKSLDQLQVPSINKFPYLVTSVPVRFQNGSDRSAFYTVRRTLKNVASEHDIQNDLRYRLNNDYCFNETGQNICVHPGYSYQSSTLTRKTKKCSNYEDLSHSNDTSIDEFDSPDKKAKQVRNKNFSNVRQQYQKLVKSMSHTSADKTQNIFRSSSVQLFSPKKKVVNGINKFNSLLSKRNQNRKNDRLKSYEQSNGKQPLLDSTNRLYESRDQSQTQKQKSNKYKSNSHSKYNKRFEIGSASSSTESLCIPNNTGFNSQALCSVGAVRRVRSTSCIRKDEEDVDSAPLSSESLPNIVQKLEDRPIYSSLTHYHSSTSSPNSDQSGFITSRSSSIASSIDITYPPAGYGTNESIDLIQKRKSTSHINKNYTVEYSERNPAKRKSANFYIDSDSSNEQNKNKPFDDIFPSKGCEQSCLYEEDIALPPPKQFRDFESSSDSFSNGVTQEENEINAIDNLLYYYIPDPTTSLCPGSSQCSKKTKKGEGTASCKASNTDQQKMFDKAKKDFKSQLKLPGYIYADLNCVASVMPYFHISDDFRVYSPEGMHLIICVHGLDGNSADLRLVKTYLELGLPGAFLDFLMSERNQGDTFSDFETMTDRLVSEILHYLAESAVRPTRISFVGHSLGNIIIRSALSRPQLKYLLPRLHTFLSLSGPHLGTLYNSSGLVNMGMWFMQKWKRSGSLLQLCLKDSSNVRQCFLYRLSKESTLHNFRNVLLCGSGQDRYVPLHSARIEMCKEAFKDLSEQGAIYREMVYNIISPILAASEVNLVRYDIHHALPNTANALIGRAAHIAVLDSELFIEKFMVVVGIKYFR